MKIKNYVTLKTFLCLVTSFFILSIMSCAIMPTKGEVGKPIDEKMVKKIQKGKTTREEIIQWFGIPMAVAKKGETIKLSGAMATPMGGGEMQGAEVSSDTYFVLFANHNITENHRIYLYIFTKTKGMGFSMPFISTMSGKTLKNTLIILMDESKGIVVDYKYEKQI